MIATIAYMVKKAKSGARVLWSCTPTEKVIPRLTQPWRPAGAVDALLEMIAAIYPQAAGAASGR